MEIALQRLERADPVAYARLCEAAGYKKEALRVYAGSTQPRDLFHAVELAWQERDYATTQELIRKTREKIMGPLHDAPPYEETTSWGTQNGVSMGEAMGRLSQHEDAKRIDSSLSKIEMQLAEMDGQLVEFGANI